MDGPSEGHTEWNKSDKEGKILYDTLYVESKRK